ncbi:hypothetical protein CK203_017124 [Vitis vinifera]|uniref:Uncharacterized protein n=1 Tax=Vitis vinifera TaxID=29760 RepID=A0A438JZL4_VITVI|nr:hypothetical protein CK203_017124 [Vitis vinifera]
MYSGMDGLYLYDSLKPFNGYLNYRMQNCMLSVPHLKTVIQLLANMESCQLNPMSEAHLPEKEPELTSQPSEPS